MVENKTYVQTKTYLSTATATETQKVLETGLSDCLGKVIIFQLVLKIHPYILGVVQIYVVLDAW
jgi:hypothetical protein